jgi:hypothetical protein
MLLHAHVFLDYAAQSAVLKDNVSAGTLLANDFHS